MLQSMGSQRVGYDLRLKKMQRIDVFLKSVLSLSIPFSVSLCPLLLQKHQPLDLGLSLNPE